MYYCMENHNKSETATTSCAKVMYLCICSKVLQTQRSLNIIKTWVFSQFYLFHLKTNPPTHLFQLQQQLKLFLFWWPGISGSESFSTCDFCMHTLWSKIRQSRPTGTIMLTWRKMCINMSVCGLVCSFIELSPLPPPHILWMTPSHN